MKTYFFEKINLFNFFFFIKIAIKYSLIRKNKNIYIGDIKKKNFNFLKIFFKDIKILNFKFDEIKKNGEFAEVFILRDLTLFSEKVKKFCQTSGFFEDKFDNKYFELFFLKNISQATQSNQNFRRLVYFSYLISDYKKYLNYKNKIIYVPSDTYWFNIFSDISKGYNISYCKIRSDYMLNIFKILIIYCINIYKYISFKNKFKKETKSSPYLLLHYLGNMNIDNKSAYSDLPFAHHDAKILQESVLFNLDKIHKNFYLNDIKSIIRYNINLFTSHASHKRNKHINIIFTNVRSFKLRLLTINFLINLSYYYIFLKQYSVFKTLSDKFSSIMNIYSNSPIYYSHFIWGAEHLPLNLSLIKFNGISTMTQMSYQHFDSIVTDIISDIFFIFSKKTYEIKHSSHSDIKNYIIVGYIGDYRFKLKNENIIKIKQKFSELNVSKVISYFDENSSDEEKFISGTDRYIRIHTNILNKVINDPTIAIIFKPKRIKNFYKHLKKIQLLFEQALKTDRVIVLGSENNSMPPANVLSISDYAIHSNFSSATAGIESILSKTPTMFLNDHSLKEGKMYEYGKNEFIFDSLEQIWKQIDYLSSKKIKFEEIYSNQFLDFLDPYRDGGSNIRIYEYINDLKINLTKGFDKKTAINIANKNFIIKWGPDKVITNEKQ